MWCSRNDNDDDDVVVCGGGQIADRVAVLGDGKLMEVGTHQDLLSDTDSALRRLVQHQLTQDI